jgi:hypothetical protein
MQKDQTEKTSTNIYREERSNNSNSFASMDAYWRKLRMDCQFSRGQSRRQINDWLMRRCRRRRVLQFDQYLTGLGGNRGQAIAVRQLCTWLDVIPEGDMIVFICESAEPERQMRVWKKWILRHNADLLPSIDEETKSFYIYKPMSLE